MRWFGWFRKDSVTVPDIEPIDVDALLNEGLQNRTAATSALAVLTRKRKDIQRGLRVLDKQSDRLTPVKVRNIARSGYGDIGPHQLAQHMQSTNAHYQDSARGEQVAALERQLQAVEEAIKRLKDHSRTQGT